MIEIIDQSVNGATLIAPEKRLSAASTPNLVSILVPCCGMIEYTKLCVPSILKYSRPPFELIFLDIGSLDGTAEYLAGIKAASAIRIEVIRTPADIGIAEACKEALREARGDYLVLLNNDTVVTEGWLNQLVKLVNLSPAMGMVGPMSNYAAPPQLVETLPYRVKPKRGKSARHFGQSEMLLDVDAMHAFAREFREKNKTKWMAADYLSGFCILLKREVLDKIGFSNVDQSPDLGLFDTDALVEKTRHAGFNLACCRDLFIHHFGTLTFSHGAPGRGEKEKDAQVSR